MKKTAVILIGIIIAVIGLHAFKSFHTTAVSGILEADPKRCRIVATNGHDSVEAGIAPDSTFRINLTKGTWTIGFTHWEYGGTIQNTIIDSMVIGESGQIELGRVRPKTRRF
ncbi:MAG: hypothetical protein EOO00_07555 [Chitinophagaceae bacterium]|nr:MAG: hypothetical protein EOO00_07555 [Chitinophagaceae bacterium]